MSGLVVSLACHPNWLHVVCPAQSLLCLPSAHRLQQQLSNLWQSHKHHGGLMKLSMPDSEGLYGLSDRTSSCELASWHCPFLIACLLSVFMFWWPPQAAAKDCFVLWFCIIMYCMVACYIYCSIPLGLNHSMVEIINQSCWYSQIFWYLLCIHRHCRLP